MLTRRWCRWRWMPYQGRRVETLARARAKARSRTSPFRWCVMLAESKGTWRKTAERRGQRRRGPHHRRLHLVVERQGGDASCAGTRGMWQSSVQIEISEAAKALGSREESPRDKRRVPVVSMARATSAACWDTEQWTVAGSCRLARTTRKQRSRAYCQEK